MPAKRRNLALADTTFIDRERLFILMKTGGRFRNSADAEPQQHTRTRFCVALKIAVQSSFTLGSCHSVMRQCEMIHPNFDVSRGLQLFACHFVKRALFTGLRNVFVGVATLRRLDPGYQRKTVECDP